MSEKKTLKIGALFAGYGGLDLAVETVIDSEVTWISEFDAGPSRILAHRFPDAPNLGDITKIDWATVAPVDIMTGGSPCQDLSHAGKRAGMKDGTRSGLWASMCEAIEIIRPKLVLWENVRGALSAEATAGDLERCELCVGDTGKPNLRALGRVLGDLAEIGYDAAWYGLRAADIGAPHGRWRVFVLAWPHGENHQIPTIEGLEELEELEELGRHTPDLSSFQTPTAQLAINGGSQHPDKRKAGGHGPTLADEVEHLLPTPAVNDMGAGKSIEHWDSWAARQKSSDGRPAPHGKSLHVEALRLLPTPMTQNNENKQSQGYGPNLGVALHLLPTPAARDFRDSKVEVAKHRPDDKDNLNRAMAHLKMELLRTPCAEENGGGPLHPDVARERNQTLRLTGQVWKPRRTRWHEGRHMGHLRPSGRQVGKTH